MADTLTDFAAAELNTRKQALNAARNALDAAAAAAKQAVDKVKTATDAVQEQTDKRAGTQRAAAAAPSAVEMDALVDELKQQEKELHKRNAKLAEEQKAAALAKSKNTRAADAVAAAQKAASDADRAKKRADDEAKAWKTITDAVTQVHDRNPSLADAADDLKKSDLYKKAKDRVEKEVPDPLRAAALGRSKALRKEASDARTAAADEAAKVLAHYKTPHGGEEGAVILAQLDFDAKAAEMRRIADAERELARIQRALEEIVGGPALNDNVLKKIDPAKPESVPEESWRRLDAFDTAGADLDAWKQVEPADIEAIQEDYAKAEKALVEALEARAKAASDLEKIQSTVGAAGEDASVIAGFAQAQVVAALRGDQ